MAIGNRIDTKMVEKEMEVKKSKVENDIIFVPALPKYTLDDIILPDSTMAAIDRTLAIRDKSKLVFEKWGLSKTHKHSKKVGINLYGPSGTGKTMVAHAIAHSLNKKIILINYADIESKYVGETPKNLTKAFQTAVETDSILFFDEADAILSRRVTNMSNATDTSVNQTRSVMLTLLNEYQGVILFATNYISNYDPAFMRRILAHIEFQLPDEAARKKMLMKLIPSEMPSRINSDIIARKYEGVSGSDIANSILLAAFKGAQSEQQIVEHIFLEEALDEVKRSQFANNGNVKVESRMVSEEYVEQQLSQKGVEHI